MSDREKVVRAVETCFDSWIDKHMNMGLDLHEVERMKREALELLKEQEQIKPIRHENWLECPFCGTNIFANMKYCYGCGKKLKWDGYAERR